MSRRKSAKNHGLWDSVCWQAADAHDALEYEQQLAQMSEVDRAKEIASRESKMSGELGRMLKAARARNESKHARAKGLVTAPAICLHNAWNIIENALMNAGYKQALLEGSAAGKDHGYGPPSLRSPAQTAALASFLDRFSPAELISLMDPKETARFIYAADGDSARVFAETIEEYYPPFQAYVRQAHRDREALLVWVI